MEPKVRIMTIRLMQKIAENAEFAVKIGLSENSTTGKTDASSRE